MPLFAFLDSVFFARGYALAGKSLVAFDSRTFMEKVPHYHTSGHSEAQETNSSLKTNTDMI